MEVELGERFELSTHCLQNSCSDQLSYPSFLKCQLSEFIIQQKHSQEETPPGTEKFLKTLFLTKWVSSMQPHEATRFWNPQKECRVKYTPPFVFLGYPIIIQKRLEIQCNFLL